MLLRHVLSGIQLDTHLVERSARSRKAVSIFKILQPYTLYYILEITISNWDTKFEEGLLHATGEGFHLQ